MMEDLDYIIQHRLHCLDDMCDSRGGEECDICEDAFRRGYKMAMAEKEIEPFEEVSE